MEAGVGYWRATPLVVDIKELSAEQFEVPSTTASNDNDRARDALRAAQPYRYARGFGRIDLLGGL